MHAIFANNFSLFILYHSTNPFPQGSAVFKNNDTLRKFMSQHSIAGEIKYRTYRGGDWFIPVIDADPQTFAQNSKKVKILLEMFAKHIHGFKIKSNTFKISFHEKVACDAMQSVLLQMALLNN